MTSTFARALAGAAFAILALGAGQASATTYCNVQRTKDGFTALRANPSASSRLVAKMRVGDEFQAHSESRGQWIKATWWKGGRFKTQRDVGYDPPNASGWVHSSLVPEDCG
jgi:hypothetical protein